MSVRKDALDMDSVQEKHERRVGDQLIEWYNEQRGGTSFRFDGRPVDTPALKYRDGVHWLGGEVVSAYYDHNDAKFHWLAKRQRPDAPDEWEGVNFEQSLVENINLALVAKCRKSYGANCLLAVYVFPDLTHADEMESLLKNVRVPATHRFDGIYLCGEFPPPLDVYIGGVLKTGRQPPERRVWQLYPK